MAHIILKIEESKAAKLEAIQDLFTLDADFENCIDVDLAQKLLNSVEGDLKQAIRNLVNQEFKSCGQDHFEGVIPEDCYEYGFIIGNRTYCEDYELEFTTINDMEICVLSYTLNQ